MSIRRRGREIALQVLYQMEWGGWEEDVCASLFRYLETSVSKGLSMDHPSVQFAKSLVEGVAKNRSALDEIIRKYAKNWRLDRMAIVDRNILRIGVYELKFVYDVPPKVAINEAIELGKRFGSEDSAPFINGILDAVNKDLGLA